VLRISYPLTLVFYLDHPMVIFLHYWGRGPADRLATGFKAALNELGKSTAAHNMAP
jgi:hypothetical protein